MGVRCPVLWVPTLAALAEKASWLGHHLRSLATANNHVVVQGSNNLLGLLPSHRTMRVCRVGALRSRVPGSCGIVPGNQTPPAWILRLMLVLLGIHNNNHTPLWQWQWLWLLYNENDFRILVGSEWNVVDTTHAEMRFRTGLKPIESISGKLVSKRMIRH
jgi:hypothetical protein